jgi:hypothetical protein
MLERTAARTSAIEGANRLRRIPGDGELGTSVEGEKVLSSISERLQDEEDSFLRETFEHASK